MVSMSVAVVEDFEDLLADTHSTHRATSAASAKTAVKAAGKGAAEGRKSSTAANAATTSVGAGSAAERRRKLRPAARKGVGGDSNQDEMLASYLSALGKIPLLSADEEKEFARDLRDTEIAYWQHFLADSDLVAHLLTNSLVLENADATAKLRTVLDTFAYANGQNTEIQNVRNDVAAFFRDFDDEQLLVAELIDAMRERCDEKKGLAAKQQRKILDEVVALRKKSMQCRNQFVQANLRLVVSVARRFHHYRLPLIDLIQEGNLGLLKSVHRFDYRKGFRFSTYAHWWIRQAIERAIMNKGAQVRLPVHVFDARREVAKAQHTLAQQLGYDPDHEQLAQSMKLSLGKLQEILQAVPREPASLDDPIGDDEDRTIGETISDHEQCLPDEKVIQQDDTRHLLRALRTLSPMEVDIIKRRFGLDHYEDETLEEIGKSYKLSRERVRQIQVQSLRKMSAVFEMRVY